MYSCKHIDQLDNRRRPPLAANRLRKGELHAQSIILEGSRSKLCMARRRVPRRHILDQKGRWQKRCSSDPNAKLFEFSQLSQGHIWTFQWCWFVLSSVSSLLQSKFDFQALCKHLNAPSGFVVCCYLRRGKGGGDVGG